MTSRLFSLGALTLVALAGCGVPDNAAIVSKAEAQQKQEDDAKKKATATPVPTPTPTPKPDVKVAEEDPAKLGVKITDTLVGTGATAEPGDACDMLYAGRLKSTGAEFDSNMKPGGQPFTFTLGSGQVIKGWDVGVKGMKAGGKRTLEIPAALGYGAQGSGDKIPPNSDLVFDIQLIDVQKAEDARTVKRETIKPGNGPQAKAGDVVTITYKGTLTNGKTFDDNGGKPIQFKLGSAAVGIPGINLAVEGMRQGQVIDATIPPALGFGPMGHGPAVPANSVLKFEITLVKIG